MTTGRLSETAFPLFYASNRVVLVSPLVAETLSQTEALADIDFLLLNSDGAISKLEEAEATPEHYLNAVGAPVGVKALIVEEGLAQSAHAWGSWFEEQTQRTSPTIEVLSGSFAVQDVFAAIAKSMVADAKATRALSARTERDLVALRWDYEQSLINLEKARRVVRGAGFDTKYATMSIPPGTGTIGTDKAVDAKSGAFKVRYVMPCDAAGLLGISLHIAQSPDEGLDGELAISLTRIVDGQSLGHAQLKYGDISKGWSYLELEKPLAGSFGDCELTIVWRQSEDGLGPVLSLSDLETEARGGEVGSVQLPAMQIWSGFTLGEFSKDNPLVPRNRDTHQAGFVDLLTYGGIIGPKGTTDEAFLELSDTWVQTHLQPGAVVGIHIPDLVPPTVSAVEVTCQTAHEAGPPALYMVAICDADRSPNPHVWADLLSAISAGEREHVGHDAEAGMSWSVSLVTPGEPVQISLNVPPGQPGVQPYQLICAAMSATDQVEYGWCRWHDVKVSYRVDSVAPVAARVEPTLLQRMRSLKFPEIAEQLEYLAGQTNLNQQTDQLGFSPMIISEDNGSLQTHPLLENISAALYRKGAPAGTTRVACDVETAHEHSPDFCYLLVLLPSSIEDKYDAVNDLVNRNIGQGVSVQFGHDKDTGAHFFARHLSALEVQQVAIDLMAPLCEPYDIVVAALPVHGMVNYGWCRWVTLNISSAIEAQSEFSMPPIAE